MSEVSFEAIADELMNTGRRSGDWIRGACPRCDQARRRRRDWALAYSPRSGVVRCFRCDLRGRAVPRTLGHRLAGSGRPDRRARALALFAEARPLIPGDVVDNYLRRRELSPIGAWWPDDLRHHSRLRHPAGGYFEGMVALVRDADGSPCGVHRLFLAGGAKARVAPVRAALGPVRRGAVRLGPVRDVLAFAEGIESALAVMVLRPDLTCWATLGTSGMAHLDVPPGVRRVVLVGDRDEPGAKAVRRTSDRLKGEGRLVDVLWPAAGDANDELRGLRHGIG